MIQRPTSCEGCPLHPKSVPGFVPDKIIPNSDYCIVGEAPGKHELTASEPFVGDAGFVLKHWLMRAVPTLQMSSERNKVSYANILHCLPPMTQGRPYPKGVEKLQAETHCTQYQQLGDAPVIILCGETPQRFYFGKELDAEDATDRSLGHDVKGVLGRVGRVYERDGRRWVFAPHPAYILRQPALVEHGQAALRIAVGCDTIAEVEYVSWGKALETLCTEAEDSTSDKPGSTERSATSG